VSAGQIEAATRGHTGTSPCPRSTSAPGLRAPIAVPTHPLRASAATAQARLALVVQKRTRKQQRSGWRSRRQLYRLYWPVTGRSPALYVVLEVRIQHNWRLSSFGCAIGDVDAVLLGSRASTVDFFESALTSSDRYAIIQYGCTGCTLYRRAAVHKEKQSICQKSKPRPAGRPPPRLLAKPNTRGNS